MYIAKLLLMCDSVLIVKNIKPMILIIDPSFHPLNYMRTLNSNGTLTFG